MIAQAIALKVIIGGGTPVDSTHLWACLSEFGKKTRSYSGKCHCPRHYSTPDARCAAKSKGYICFGWKVHLVVDTKSELPLDVRGTPASESDLPRAKHLLKGAKKRRPEIRIASTSMHCAYNSYENHRFAVKRVRAAPIVTLNPTGTVDAITDGALYLTDDGTHTCFAGFKGVYWGNDEKPGCLNFRCPAALARCQCLFRSTCSL